MNRFIARLAFLCLALLLVAFTVPAFAQDTTIDGASIFGAWKPYIQELVGIVVAAILGWIALLAKSKFGIDIEARHREALQSALENAAGLAVGKLDRYLGEVKIDVKNPALAEGVEYVLASVPDALKYFGLTPERIRMMLLAKIGALGVSGAVAD
jgi:hypothetical protein